MTNAALYHHSAEIDGLNTYPEPFIYCFEPFTNLGLAKRPLQPYICPKTAKTMTREQCIQSLLEGMMISSLFSPFPTWLRMIKTMNDEDLQFLLNIQLLHSKGKLSDEDVISLDHILKKYVSHGDQQEEFLWDDHILDEMEELNEVDDDYMYVGLN